MSIKELEKTIKILAGNSDIPELIVTNEAGLKEVAAKLGLDYESVIKLPNVIVYEDGVVEIFRDSLQDSFGM